MSGITNQQILDALDDPVVVVDEQVRIRRANEAAHRLFPGLAEGIGIRLDRAFPELGSVFGLTDDGGESDVVSVGQGAGSRYFVPNATQLTIGPQQVGWALFLRDVTALEEQRRELARQNEQMDQFAEAIAHELRNTLAVATGNLSWAADAVDDGDLEAAGSAVASADDAAERMIDIVDDLMTVAQYSQVVEDGQELDFASTAESALAALDGASVDLHVAVPGTIVADPGRFDEIVQNAGRLAARTGSSTLRAALTDDGFTLLTDGDPLPGDDVDRAFEYGTAVPSAESGMLLPNIQTLARSHGWSVTADPDYSRGIKVTVSGATTDPTEDTTFG